MNFGIIPASAAPYLHSLLRIVAGLLFLEHGTGKLLGFPAGLPYLDKMPTAMLWITGLLELVGGALIVLGLFTRPTAFVLSGFMAVAFFLGHVAQSGVFFPVLNGGEAAILFCFVFLYLAAAGAGPISVDRK
jgi:putative oxidoreductase